jgi:hypothetical protein
MKELTANELLIELRCLRAHLDPVLNSRMKNVLTEAERRLTRTGISTHEKFDLKKSQQGNRTTKEQILNKWLNKY